VFSLWYGIDYYKDALWLQRVREIGVVELMDGRTDVLTDSRHVA
jgi:hypothetical protein